MKKNKSLKTAILEVWYGIDYLFFGNKNPKECLDENNHKSYLAAKNSLLYNLSEIYSTVKYISENKYDNLNELRESISDEVNAIQELTVEGIKNGEHKELLTESVHTFKENEMISANIASAAVVPRLTSAIILDNFLIIKAFSDFGEEELDKLYENQSLAFLLDAHDKFRDTLVEISFIGRE